MNELGKVLVVVGLAVALIGALLWAGFGQSDVLGIILFRKGSRLFKRNLYVAVFLIVFAPNAFSMSFENPPPAHAWTVEIGRGFYGIGGDPAETYIFCGNRSFTIAVPFWQFIGLSALSSAIVLFGLVIYRRTRRSRFNLPDV